MCANPFLSENAIIFLFILLPVFGNLLAKFMMCTDSAGLIWNLRLLGLMWFGASIFLILIIRYDELQLLNFKSQCFDIFNINVSIGVSEPFWEKSL